MMRKYAEESPILKLKEKQYHNEEHIRNLLFALMVGRGFVLVDNNYRGMAAAIVTPNIWCPDVNEVRELAWWVDPAHRNGTIGGKLFLAYQKKAQELVDQERAEIVLFSMMPQSPPIDLTSRGFKQIDSTYCKE